MSEAQKIAAKLTEAQRMFLLRHEPHTDKQAIPEDECFNTGFELYVNLDDDWRDYWFAGMGAHSSEGSARFDECWMFYTSLGLEVRKILEAQS